MRLSDKFRFLAEQLNDLYQYRDFLEERICVMELELKEIDDMMEFADCMNNFDISSAEQE